MPPASKYARNAVSTAIFLFLFFFFLLVTIFIDFILRGGMIMRDPVLSLAGR